jgi:hypothetical protein
MNNDKRAARSLGASGVLLLALSLPAVAQDAPQEAAGARLPQVLKGSALAPKRAASTAWMAPPFQVAAGERLWLVDQSSGTVVACRLADTADFGRRDVRCYTDDLPARLLD